MGSEMCIRDRSTLSPPLYTLHISVVQLRQSASTAHTWDCRGVAINFALNKVKASDRECWSAVRRQSAVIRGCVGDTRIPFQACPISKSFFTTQQQCYTTRLGLFSTQNIMSRNVAKKRGVSANRDACYESCPSRVWKISRKIDVMIREKKRDVYIII